MSRPGSWHGRVTRRDFVRAAAVGFGAAAAGSLPRSLVQKQQEDAAGAAHAHVDGPRFSLSNGAVSATWDASGGRLRLLRVEDRRNRVTLAVGRGPFSVTLGGGVLLDAADMALTGPPRIEELAPNPLSSRFSDRLPGRRISVTLRDADQRVEAAWASVLRDGSAYVRQEITLTALGSEAPLEEITLVDLDLPAACVAGTVNGSPLVAGSWFAGFEHPLAASAAGRRARASLARSLPLKAGSSVTYSSVIGVAAPGQMRRDFLAYVERERAHPYRTFLHYNSWYDLGYFTRFDEAGALEVIDAFGRELHVRRGVALDSFLFDDGWDDRKLWGFHEGFPRGFAPLADAAARYASAPGVWLSPWGGYGKPRQERLAFGREQGFETNEEGFALSGPIYYRRFREVCLEMVRRFGVNQFKIDGTGSSEKVIAGSAFGSDFEAAICLINDLRAEKPDLYVNLTTGTYPSPFWLWHADSTWRGGDDHDFAGVGSDRQRWITYRDADTFRHVVEAGPLYPLNSLMLHGLIYAKYAKKLDTDPGGDFGSEVRSFFGSGTQLQEMYLTHSLLSQDNWDVLAQAARWSRSNAGTLVDSHWIGGDPARIEVYGWAAWSRAKGIVTLRNPSGRPQSFALDVRAALELPDGAPRRFRGRNPWERDGAAAPIELEAGKALSVALRPFEVLTLETTPS